MKNFRTGVAIAMIPVFCLVFFPGCFVNSGYLKKNPSLYTEVQNNRPLPDYAYYYSGRSHLPYAVIGLDKKLSFSTMGWFAIEDRSEVYQKISNLDDRPGFGVSSSVYPADIVDAEGRKVGIWFSYYTHTAISVDHQEKSVVVLNPYSPNGDRKGR